MVEWEEAAAGMIENTIRTMRISRWWAALSSLKKLHSTQQRVDQVVVVGVVAVIGSGLENGIEVNGSYAEVSEIIEFFQNAHQVAAFKAVNGGKTVPAFKLAWFGDLAAPGKAVRENLIKNRIFNPIGVRL